LGAPALKLALPNQFDHPMTIGDKAFNYANIVIDDTANPGKAILSKNIKSIGFEAFRNDNKMVGQIYLPDSLETMSNDVFVGTNLTWDSTTHTGLTCSYDDINGYAT
jgi:hypothetical protein